MIERKITPTAKIAVFAVVHGVYFEQFEGLFESLTGFHKDLIGIVKKMAQIVEISTTVAVFPYF